MAMPEAAAASVAEAPPVQVPAPAVPGEDLTQEQIKTHLQSLKSEQLKQMKYFSMPAGSVHPSVAVSFLKSTERATELAHFVDLIEEEELDLGEQALAQMILHLEKEKPDYQVV